ncbi:MAG: hypothetical protein A3F12_02950 [Gammaproteobacteria bacterium RIFCSPHIGHO2_12_FULL_38_14]|nr:MAG: hypothetical protein A3F12_02950 [Gammaproteobacteria bacterium RIFCSPHIGHO2_12_FULL_38_14]
MKLIGITQRVDYITDYNERRDSLDQRWTHFIKQLGFYLFPFPNHATNSIENILDSLFIHAIILSGGNSISQMACNAMDVAAERDCFEQKLIEAAVKRNIPIIGVCRGMQMLNLYFGGTLDFIEGHIACRHSLIIKQGYEQLINPEVNSFHHWSISQDSLAKDFIVIAYDKNHRIEGFVHQSLKILGIMWHPERETPFTQRDIQLIRTFLV